jgi:aminoglycoside phosphotransferase (APT) family kinase protein
MGLIEDAVERVSAAWNSTIAVTAVLTQHHERAVFETISPSGPVVVKVDTSVAKHQREESVLRAAGQAGIPVPAVVHSEPGPPSLLVLRFIDGIPLHREVDGAGWRSAGHVLQRLHGLSWPAGAGAAGWSGRTWPDHFRWWADHERDQLLTDGPLPAPVIHQMHRYLSATFSGMGEPALHLLHGDCQTDHYLMTAGSSHIAGVLDFGDAVVGDPVWDLALLTLDVPHMLGELLRGYHPDTSTERRTHELLPAYQLVRRLGSARWMREHGQPHAPDLEAAVHILARTDLAT